MLSHSQGQAELDFFTAGASAGCTLPNLTSFFIECSFQADTEPRESLYIRGSDRVSGSGELGKFCQHPRDVVMSTDPTQSALLTAHYSGCYLARKNLGLGKIVRWFHVLPVVQNSRPVL
jgi:hypothetical protein